MRNLPKSYSEQERSYIQTRLKEEAAKCLAQYGIRRTTVDELVKRVKIPKGTFYLFYPSKELLLFDVILDQHHLMDQKIAQSLSKIQPDSFSAEQLTDILFEFYKMAAELPILKLIHSDEMELLARRLPQEVLAEHFHHDNTMIETLFAALPIKPKNNPNVFTAAFRALFFTLLHKDEIGEEFFDQGLRALLYGLAVQMM